MAKLNTVKANSNINASTSSGFKLTQFTTYKGKDINMEINPDYLDFEKVKASVRKAKLYEKMAAASGTKAITNSVITSPVTKAIATTSTKSSQKGSNFWSGVGGFFSSLGKGIKNTCAKVVNGVSSAVSWVADKGKKAGAAVVKTAKTVANAVVDFGKKAADTVKTGAKKVWNGLKSAGSWLVDKSKKVGAAVVKTVKTGAKKIAGAAEKAANAVGDFFKKAGCSIINGVVGVGEGVLQLVEHVYDAAVFVGGGLMSIGTGLYDLGGYIINGKNHKSATKKLWTEGVMPVVSYDATGKVMDALYSTKPMKAINKNSVGFMQRADESEGIKGGLVRELIPGITEAAGIVVISVATCGAGGVAIGGSTISATTGTAILTGVTSLGKNAQKNFSKLKDENGSFENVKGKEIVGASLKSISRAALDAGIAATAGKVGKAVGKAYSAKHGLSAKLAELSSGGKIPTVGQVFKATWGREMASGAATGVFKALKEPIGELTDYAADKIAGKDAKYDWEEVGRNAFNTFIGELVVSGTGAKTFIGEKVNKHYGLGNYKIAPTGAENLQSTYSSYANKLTENINKSVELYTERAKLIADPLKKASGKAVSGMVKEGLNDLEDMLFDDAA